MWLRQTACGSRTFCPRPKIVNHIGLVPQKSTGTFSAPHLTHQVRSNVSGVYDQPQLRSQPSVWWVWFTTTACPRVTLAPAARGILSNTGATATERPNPMTIFRSERVWGKRESGDVRLQRHGLATSLLGSEGCGKSEKADYWRHCCALKKLSVLGSSCGLEIGPRWIKNFFWNR
jgi:hypothetical protein